MKRISFVLLVVLAGCSTSQSNAYRGENVRQTNPASVDILYSEPRTAFRSIGTVSARHYQPGFVDPTISDAREAIQKAGAQIGADAVIVRSSSAAPQTRLITIEGEAITYKQ